MSCIVNECSYSKEQTRREMCVVRQDRRIEVDRASTWLDDTSINILRLVEALRALQPLPDTALFGVQMLPALPIC
jgi:hypothetical protein